MVFLYEIKDAVMRCPPVRFAIRSLMAVVMAAGFGSALFVLKLRHDLYADPARHFSAVERNWADFERLNREHVQQLEETITYWKQAGMLDLGEDVAPYLKAAREDLPRIGSFRQHYSNLRKKYELAATRPWLVVEADPTSDAKDRFDRLRAGVDQLKVR
jgi:hypothetical protein